MKLTKRGERARDIALVVILIACGVFLVVAGFQGNQISNTYYKHLQKISETTPTQEYKPAPKPFTQCDMIPGDAPCLP